MCVVLSQGWKEPWGRGKEGGGALVRWLQAPLHWSPGFRSVRKGWLIQEDLPPCTSPLSLQAATNPDSGDISGPSAWPFLTHCLAFSPARDRAHPCQTLSELLSGAGGSRSSPNLVSYDLILSQGSQTFGTRMSSLLSNHLSIWKVPNCQPSGKDQRRERTGPFPSRRAGGQPPPGFISSRTSLSLPNVAEIGVRLAGLCVPVSLVTFVFLLSGAWSRCF